MTKPQVQILRVGYAQGYCKLSKNKGRFVITDAQLKKIEKQEELNECKERQK